ncbi:hypothetical protein H4684_004072 [Desulfomicrobium macestii]|uniref:Uncharacterized protein n=1 Tax=Desulfomicrobium macestii TaxID=90731 RepID=A0ABR9H9Z2_9BACT|nr:hypothetical protein [Desulfomicrobium macestii]MBE1427378.1 hypothetical protein [Desulfomicrobium macestii]
MSDSKSILSAKISKRNFIKIIAGSVLSISTSNNLFSYNKIQESKNSLPFYPQNLDIPPIFCIAYISPNVEDQKNQEHIVAKYPLVIVPQDQRYDFIRWRDKVKSINPDIKMLAYHMVIEETDVPGPGHDKLRKVKDSWCVYPGGLVPMVDAVPRKMRIFDPRKSEWRSCFLDGCRATLSAYPYDGLFLDQCSVFVKSNPFPGVRDEMRRAIQDVLLQLRKEFPNMLLIGNSRYSWSGLNGEMNEFRLNEIERELRKYPGHSLPRVELVQTYLKHSNDINTIVKEMSIVHAHGGFYGTCVKAQQVLWFEEFDQVIRSYNEKKLI